MEVELTKLVLEDVKIKLKEPLKEAEVEKAIEASALEQIMVLSVETNASHSSTSESVARITMSNGGVDNLAS